MKSDLKGEVIIVMGVSGSGKTSVGRLLASELSVPFIDADDHHPLSNIEKMSNGIPLTDEDRRPWLDQLNKMAIESLPKGCVIACSALKVSYRSRLEAFLEVPAVWIYLHGTYDQIFERMKNREGHFMREEMLRSQFETLEAPTEALRVEISDPPAEIVRKIKSNIR